MTSNPVSALTVALLLIGAAADQSGNADTIIPMTQDRFTSVLLDTDCDGQTSAGEAAAGVIPTRGRLPDGGPDGLGDNDVLVVQLLDRIGSGIV